MKGLLLSLAFILTLFASSKGLSSSPYKNQNILSIDVPTENEIEPIYSPYKRSQSQNYTPTWASIDSRPLPQWYDKAKIGIFLHWGVFSVPSFGSEWFWYYLGTKSPAYLNFMAQNYAPKFTYQDFGPQFTAEFFDPVKWADIFKNAGAKYLVLTSKHHEGYTLWPSKYSFGWNSMDVGPKRDLVGELAEAVRNKTDIRFGLYHSWFEFWNPLYLEDKRNGYNTSRFVKYKALPELKELVVNYKPEVIWSDGEWEADENYWKSKEFLAWLYNASPVKDTIVVNDRWGKGTSCKHGGFFSCQDHYNPGHLVPYKWENAMTVDKNSWGYRRNANLGDYRTPLELITELVTTISCGGNFLINVGPTKEGTISPILEERLLQIGQWLGINGEAIYESTPWTVAQNDSISAGVWYTTKPNKLFAILLEDHWPTGPDLILGSLDSSKISIDSITLLGLDSGKKLIWVVDKKGIRITLPSIPPNVVNKWAWTFVINFH